MKLRILDHTLRFRLTKTEVKSIEDAAVVRASVQFARNSILSFAIIPHAHKPDVTFEDRTIEVHLPEEMCSRLSTSDSLEFFVANAEPDGLKIIVEKDYGCLKPRPGLDDADTFENTNQGKC